MDFTGESRNSVSNLLPFSGLNSGNFYSSCSLHYSDLHTENVPFSINLTIFVLHFSYSQDSEGYIIFKVILDLISIIIDGNNQMVNVEKYKKTVCNI